MLYFIPAWYSGDEWKENEHVWYMPKKQSEFDDTVKQIQLFHRSGAYPYQILILGYSPNLRHFLHRQSVFHASYWSCFDAILQVKRKRPAVFSFHDLVWPENVEFVYSHFAVVAFANGKKYAQIGFGEYGNMIFVEMFENDIITKRNIYDDRGFVSCTVYYENGEEYAEKYWDERGKWKLTRFLSDGHVEINPENNAFDVRFQEIERTIFFAKLRYNSMEEIVREVFTAFIWNSTGKDIFCAAMHPLHTKLLAEVLYGKKTVLSFFKERIDFVHDEGAMEMLRFADYIITDTLEYAGKIKEELGTELKNIIDITPFDSRIDFGISQQLSVQNIIFPIDNIEMDIYKKAIVSLAGYLSKHTKIKVCLFTRKSDYNRNAYLYKLTQDILRENGFNPEWAREPSTVKRENNEDEGKVAPVLFYVNQCIDELSVSNCFRRQRVLLDLHETPDLYLQIQALSMGIPQVARNTTQYLYPDKNGKIIEDISHLDKELSFYLESISNWNEAMIASVEIGKNYTTKKLVERWNQVIEVVKANESLI